MTDDRRAKMLETIRALIAKADGTTYTEEADAFRAKADELMEKYTIELWMVTEAQDALGKRPTPESRWFDFAWFREHPRKSELWALMSYTSYHCRCRVITHSWRSEQIAVVGLPLDLDYFDMLFTHLMLEMGRRLLPHVDPNLSAGENAFNLRTANLGWPETAFYLSSAGMLPWPKDPISGALLEGWKYERIQARAGLPVAQKWRRAARKLYRDYIRDNGLESMPNKKPEVAARSYAQGFVQQLATKMRNQERVREERNTGTSTALALRDIRVVIDEFIAEHWPLPEIKGGRSRAVAVRPEAFDPASYQRGSQDARDVDIVQSAHGRIGNRKAIEG